MRAFIAIFCILTTSLTALAGDVSSYSAEILHRTSPNVVPKAEVLISAYQAKCVYPPQVPQPCFLLEQDINPKGRVDRVLLFRGESSIKSQPVTSSFYRTAKSESGFCRSCDESELTKYLFDVGTPLEKGFELPVYLRRQDLSWRDMNGRLAALNNENKKTLIELLAIRHKIGAGLYFEEGKQPLFDPLISFSYDPFVADLFGGISQKKEGVLWIVSVPKSALNIVKRKDCQKQSLVVGKLYDFNACIDEAISQQESEINAYLYLPKDYYFGKILNR